MNTFVHTHKRKLILGAIIVLVFVGFKLSRQNPGSAPEENRNPKAESTEPVTREAAVVVFGDWSPSQYRTVLGQVVSDSDIEVKAELNGTIAQVPVKVGDNVVAGQILARFKTTGDPTAINYQSAVNSLESTKLSAQNSVRSAEIALENAKKSLSQTIAQQDQHYQQAYETLRAEEAAVDTLIETAVDTIDKHVQFSNKYLYNQSFAYSQIGNSDSIGRQQVITAGRQARITADALPDTPVGASESQILQNANARLRLLQTLQNSYNQLELLVERTAANSRISESQIASFQAAIEGVHASLDGKTSAYLNQIEAAKGAREGTRLAILNAQNGVESAQQNLELSQAQAKAQITGAQNQVNLAGASTADLVVRAPISGTITEKSVKVGDLVNPGTPLFTVVNQSENKKVVAYLTQDEWLQAQRADTLEVEVNGQIVVAQSLYLSPELNVNTQKVMAELTIPAETSLVGNLATVRIPLGSSSDSGSNLLPFSAVSFEPDGAEVLVLDAQNVAQRRKVAVDQVVVSSIEILSGVSTGDRVVEYYKRVLPGEIVQTSVTQVPTPETTTPSLTSGAVMEQDAPQTFSLTAQDE